MNSAGPFSDFPSTHSKSAKYSFPHSSFGLQINKVQNRLSIKLEGSEINLIEISEHLYSIYLCGLSYSISDLSLSNLPISEIDAKRILKIFESHPKIEAVSIKNCAFEKELEFFSSLPSFSLNRLELNGCSSGIEEILIKCDKSLEILKLENNEISFDFGHLASLLEKFTSLRCLILSFNQIRFSNFEVFFNLISSLQALIELNLCNDGVLASFLKLLSLANFDFKLECLTLAQQTNNFSCNLAPLLKLKSLKSLCLPVELFNASNTALTSFLQQQPSALKSISAVKKNCENYYYQFKYPKISYFLIFDLQNVNFPVALPQNLNQLKGTTKLVVNDFPDNGLTSLLNSLESLPNLAELEWRTFPNIAHDLFTNKCPNLKSLVISGSSFANLMQSNLPTRIIFPNLQNFDIYCETMLKWNIEFSDFFSNNPGIKSLATREIILEDFSECLKQILKINVEEWFVHVLKVKDIAFISSCLTCMPKLKKLHLCFWLEDAALIPENSICQMLTRIEELIVDKFYKSKITSSLSVLLNNMPLLKILTVKCLTIEEFEMIVNSLKMFPNLRQLRIINCQLNPELIAKLFDALRTLNYLTILEVESKESQDFSQLITLKNRFLKKSFLNFYV